MVILQEQDRPTAANHGLVTGFWRLAAVVVLATAGSLASAQEQPDRQVTPAKVIRFNARWPGDLNREALVVLDFTIKPDGTASDISVADTGFHEKRFVDAAIHGLRNARFTPRMVNGVPQSCSTRIPIRFTMGAQARGVTEDFRKEVLRVEKLINERDFAGAHFHAQWMLSEKVTLLYEYAALQGTLANTYARVGETHAALIAAREATARSSTEIVEFTPGAPIPKNAAGKYLLNTEFVQQLLELRMVLAASLGLSVESLDAYSQLAGLRQIPPEDRLARTATQMTEQVLGGQPLVANARLDERGQWEQRLYRHTIAIRDVNSGSLNNTRLTCHGKSVDHQFKADEEWSIPASQDSCTLYFDGEPGTRFHIVESTRTSATPSM